MSLHFDMVDMRLLVSVAESNSVTRGAEACHLSTPAASARIKNLEHGIGTRLFHRTHQGVTLTPSGQAFVLHARQVRGSILWGMVVATGLAGGLKLTLVHASAAPVVVESMLAKRFEFANGIVAAPPSLAPTLLQMDILPALSIALERPSLGFGNAAAGETPAPLSQQVTVTSNSESGYALAVHRSAFVPADLPLGLAASAPNGGQLGGSLAGGAMAPIPITPAADLLVGTTAAPSAPAGDAWATSVGFVSPLPNVVAGRYTATVTFSVPIQVTFGLGRWSAPKTLEVTRSAATGPLASAIA